jgi:hypothetical protein
MSTAERCYKPWFSPQPHFNQVPLEQIQHSLRAIFARWGLPGRLRVDNGSPWGSWSDLPTPLALWWIGLGCAVHWNTPRRPQENGKVEHSHALGQRWAEPERCGSVAELQRRLDEEDHVQRELYPHRDGRSRWEVYPGLQQPQRPYSRVWEAEHWDWNQAVAHLSTYVVVRRVDGSGKIGLYGDKVYVGASNRRREVLVQLDGAAWEWLICDREGRELCRRPVTQIDAAEVRELGKQRKSS